MERKHIVTSLSIVALLLAADRLTLPDAGIGGGLVAIVQALGDWTAGGELAVDAFYTVARVVGGFLIALILGVSVGLLTGRFASASEGSVHALNYLRAITPVALAPFFLVLFGIGEYSKVFLIAWGAFFPIWINAHLGVKSLPSELVASARLLGLSGSGIVRHFFLPATISAAYPGARVAIGVSFILAYVSETLGADQGVGYRLGVAYATMQVPLMSAALCLLGALGLLADRAFVLATRHLTPWMVYERRDEN